MTSKQYEWSQDINSINVTIPITGASLKNIDVYLTDLVLKINVKSTNIVKILDLESEIDYTSRENRTTYNNGLLELYIKKAEPKSWDSLTAKSLSKDETRKRRDESFKRREDREAELQSQRSDLKTSTYLSYKVNH